MKLQNEKIYNEGTEDNFYFNRVSIIIFVCARKKVLNWTATQRFGYQMKKRTPLSKCASQVFYKGHLNISIFQQGGHYQVFIFPDYSLRYHVFCGLQFISGIAKSNIDNSYPLTKYGNKIYNVITIWKTCKTTDFSSQCISLTFPWNSWFPW